MEESGTFVASSPFDAGGGEPEYSVLGITVLPDHSTVSSGSIPPLGFRIGPKRVLIAVVRGHMSKTLAASLCLSPLDGLTDGFQHLKFLLRPVDVNPGKEIDEVRSNDWQLAWSGRGF